MNLIHNESAFINIILACVAINKLPSETRLYCEVRPYIQNKWSVSQAGFFGWIRKGFFLTSLSIIPSISSFLLKISVVYTNCYYFGKQKWLKNINYRAHEHSLHV